MIRAPVGGASSGWSLRWAEPARQSSGSVTHCSTISLRLGFSMAAATRSLSLICLLTGDNDAMGHVD
ncbi:hypothetical protein EYF80_032314 [Liparis tanakae]|uniref:Uncharacterized protein n=1 Tax=Liparis tanakae TaxID=230148 RepID=A0A4Z2GW74_9TELE|nr:hypothetical protein EYF80_032314 [Liparis tanakae]